MAQTEFLQGEITERFLPATGVEELSGESGQAAFLSSLIVITTLILVATLAHDHC
jgi:hypothetical protein